MGAKIAKNLNTPNLSLFFSKKDLNRHTFKTPGAPEFLLQIVLIRLLHVIRIVAEKGKSRSGRGKLSDVFYFSELSSHRGRRYFRDSFQHYIVQFRSRNFSF